MGELRTGTAWQAEEIARLRARVAELEAERQATAREHLKALNSMAATIEAREAERACDE